MPESLDSDLLLLGDISCIPFFCRSNQTQLWSAQWVAPYWPHCWLPQLPLWTVDESRAHKEWPELPTLEWGEAVQSCYLHLSHLIKYQGVLIQLLFILCEDNVYWILVYNPPLCMIAALTVAFMQYTVCNRLFYRLSKVSLLCQPFRRCGQVSLFLYWWCWVSKGVVIASAPNLKLSRHLSARNYIRCEWYVCLW